VNRIFGAILEKDVRSLFALVLLTALLFAGDVLITRLDLVPLWKSFGPSVLLIAGTILIFSVFQLDAPASLVDDWLCRPVPRKELLTAKLVLVFAVIYLSRAAATFIVDLALGYPLTEALPDAALLQDRHFLLILPILLITAVITQTLVQGIGVLIALFVCVFMIPTPLVQAPGPLDPGIGDALNGNGLVWLATTPAKVAAMILVALTFWLVYWRRRLMQARILLVLTVGLVLFFVFLPMWLLPWKSVFSLQTTLARAEMQDEISASIHLRNSRVCFPATRIGELASNASFNAALRQSGLRPWTDEDLRASGPESIAFLTGIEPRALPLDWRVKLAYVQADYSVDGDAPKYSLRPAFYNTGDGSSLLMHAWVLPDTAVQRLKSQDVSLRLSYSLTLLKPRHFRVPTDGKRHALPGLGHCSAVLNAAGNSIDVDCFSAFERPAQVSAELNEIPASRVYGMVDFAPAWVKWPYSQRAQLEIGSPRLARHESITVTAWDVAGYVDKSLILPGILGADAKTCPLPDGDHDGFQKSRWRDSAPHEAQSIRVDEGVQLEVLDFGGQGSPILLLPGLGATAHSFDDFAPLLTHKHRVIALTRRGTGYSSKPDFGFDTARLAQDVLQVMDAMGLEKTLLVGSSIAGDELTWLGGHHPERFSGLVYLDAAYDRSGDPAEPTSRRLRELGRLLPPEPPIPPEALLNFDSMTKFLVARGHVPYPEGELIALLRVNDPLLAGNPSIDAATQQAISAAIEAPDYAALKIPALAIYAFADPNAPLSPWYDPKDRELLANLAERSRISDAMKRDSIELFRRKVAQGQVLELQNATHHVYLSNPREVLEAIEKFAD
jgi:pimeloyl-ACP methyl ester carboxylesterase